MNSRIIRNFPKVPTQELGRIEARQFVNINYPPWPGQRIMSFNWVEDLVAKQINYINHYGTALIPGSFAIITLNGTSYLADGQHRAKMLETLMSNNKLPQNTFVLIENWVVWDKKTGDDIYVLINNRNVSNGNIDKSGNVADKDHIQEAVMELQTRFQSQTKCSNGNPVKAPYFDPNVMLTELRKLQIIHHMDKDTIVHNIITHNKTAEIKAKWSNDSRYSRCKAGFYLVYEKPCCRWIADMKWEI